MKFIIVVDADLFLVKIERFIDYLEIKKISIIFKKSNYYYNLF